MEEERRVASDSEAEEVVQLEEAVEMLVEQLVLPVLSRGKELGRENALSSPEYQQTVAGQVHAKVLLYNYYHRKQFPQLEFASPDQFCLSTSLTITKNNLHMYLDLAHNSVANKAIIDACDIAKALDPTKNSPDMIMWPISKVAVLLINRTKKVCLLQRGSQTMGVWSIFEKDVETALLTSPLSSGVPVQGSSNQFVALPSGPYMLQQIAYSEVELKTGMKRMNLRFIEEHQVYSSSKKGTATMLYLMDYDQTTNSKIKEMPLDVLIERMSGPIFESGPCPRTTSVVEYYDLLPYKEVLLNIHIRDCPLGTSLMKGVGLKEQEANINSKCKMKKITTNISTPKKNKQVAQAVGGSGTNNCMTDRKKKDSNTNYKRK